MDTPLGPESSQDAPDLSLLDVISLHEHLLDLGATLDLPRLHAEILQTCVALMAADKGNLQVFDHATGMLSIVAQIGFEPEFLQTFARITAEDENHSVCSRAVVRRQRAMSGDLRNETEFAAVREAATTAGFRSVQSTPVFSSAGELLAVVSTHWCEPHQPTDCQIATMDRFLRPARSSALYGHALISKGAARVRPGLGHPIEHGALAPRHLSRRKAPKHAVVNLHGRPELWHHPSPSFEE